VRAAPSQHAVTLDDKRAFLSRAETHGSETATVKVVETHMSLVFLTDSLAYKLKKPVHYPYLDFRTLEAREKDCREELRLNRRLAKEIYLDVVPLSVSKEGALKLGANGATADWLVRMRRLDDARFLDRAIAAGAVSLDDIERVGAPLVRFYTQAEPAAVDPDAYVGRFEAEHETSVLALRDERYDLPGTTVRYVDTAQRQFLREERALLVERVRARQIVEGHGDLRPEHVHLGPPVNIIDCLEFSRWLRLVDPFDELAFFCMECERLGAKDFADGLLSYCAERLQRPAGPRLIAYYKSFRALLRARLCILHLAEPEPREPAKWPRLAKAYLDLAARYARALTEREAR
jgi:aminoglycoside phosphotransferase family enzyme